MYQFAIQMYPIPGKILLMKYLFYPSTCTSWVSEEMKLAGNCNVGEMFFLNVSLMPSIQVFPGCPLALYIDEIIECNFPPVINRQKYIL